MAGLARQGESPAGQQGQSADAPGIAPRKGCRCSQSAALPQRKTDKTSLPSPSHGKAACRRLQLSSTFVCPEHALGIGNAKTVRTTELLGDTGGAFVSIRACPVTLQLQQVLQGGHRARARLHEAFDGAVMCLGGDVTASIGDHIDLEALIQRRQGRTDNAYRSPQARQNDAALADLVDLLD